MYVCVFNPVHTLLNIRAGRFIEMNVMHILSGKHGCVFSSKSPPKARGRSYVKAPNMLKKKPRKSPEDLTAFIDSV